MSGAVLFQRTKPPRRHTGASDREHGQVNVQHDVGRAAENKTTRRLAVEMADQRVATRLRSGPQELPRGGG